MTGGPHSAMHQNDHNPVLDGLGKLFSVLTVFCCSRVNGWMDMAKDRNIFARMHETSFFSQFFRTLYVIHLYVPIEHYMY